MPRRSCRVAAMSLVPLAVLLAPFTFADEPAKPAAPVAPAPAADAAAENVAETLAEIIKKHDVPAMSAVVISRGKVVMLGSAGVRVRGKDAKVTDSDLWHLGSCTKSMTATLCAIAVDRGVLKWEQTLGETFPEYAEQMTEPYRKVTLRQLLTNRGGVPTDLKFDQLWSRLWNFKGDATSARKLLLEVVTKRQPPEAPKGIGRFEYSNGGFSIAGLMLEKATGRPFDDLMQEWLFKPLKITSAGFGPPGNEEKLDQPWGHRAGGSPMPPSQSADNPPAVTPAGRAHMTITDWAKYAAAHLDGAAIAAEQERLDRLNTADKDKIPETATKKHDAAVPIVGAPERVLSRPGELLTADSWRTLHTMAPKSAEKDAEYAMGWSVTQRPWASPGDGKPGNVLTHSGSNTMWFCVAWLAKDADFAVLICCNQADRGNAACDEAASKLIGKFKQRNK